MATAVRQARPGVHLDAGRRTTGPPRWKDGVAVGLGWFSVGLGVSQLVAPRAVERVIGLRDNRRRRSVIRLVGVREVAAGAGILGSRKPAPWLWARVAGDVKDLALLGFALTRSDARRGRVAAVTTAVAGITAVDVAEGLRSSRGAAAPGDAEIVVRQAVTVNKEPNEVYAFWRDLERFPRFMAHVESVQVTGERQSRWRVRAPGGRTVEWTAEVTDDRPGELLAWRTLPPADVDHRGEVRFVEAPGGRGTEVHVDLRYSPPAGAVGAVLAKLLGEEPEAQAYDDLRRFKQLLETGELARSEGTPGGTSLVQQLLQRAAQPPGREREQDTTGKGGPR